MKTPSKRCSKIIIVFGGLGIVFGCAIAACFPLIFDAILGGVSFVFVYFMEKWLANLIN